MWTRPSAQVEGTLKQGAAYGYTKVLGYHPILASRADTGEIIHARMRKGSANTSRGARRFIDEVVARIRRAGAAGEIVMRFDRDSGPKRPWPSWLATGCATPWR